ncbi:beta-ribofuranosylaminobenzene 5'-phosphate synthase family protein, partial [Acidisphaera sp. S103]|uniref:beta-ribofuranosylaminobenzene 5'-phosphate synthase family protein n=1 Tax=Acidisphaera sp. S103 TaxID=1747223 RepID=UPI00352D9FDF
EGPPSTPSPKSGPQLTDGGTAVTVTCTARLHLGFFDLDGGLGRRFGSIGLSLDQPVTRLTVRRSDITQVHGPEHDRVTRYLAQMCSHLGLTSHHAVEIEQAMPPHAGLGSGTQLALAVAAAVRRLHGRPDDPRGDATHLGRGARSGIGIGLFSQGGLVIDGGRGTQPGPPPLLARAALPEAWRVLLVLDRHSEGLSGPQERAAFDSLDPMDPAISGAICRLVLMQALPALAEHDLPGFGSAITAIQAHVGDYFAPSQGGRFTSPGVGAALRLLADAGATGVGQSSWGPTGFAFAENEREAHRLSGELEARGALKQLDLLICRVLNRGASVDVA